MKEDDESYELWRALLAANQDQKYLSNISAQIEALGGRFDGPKRKFRIPLGAKLEELIQRARDLTDEWYTHDEEIESSVQDIAWRFAAHAFDLHRGDQAVSVDYLFVREETLGELGTHGHILTKKGVPGRRRMHFYLLWREWSKITA